MAAYYFDTSAIVKRYDPREIGSQWVRSLFGSWSADLFLFSQRVIVEVTSAFFRKWREGAIAESEGQVALDAFHQDSLHQYLLDPVSESILLLASDLIKRHPLRAYDAVQLATAISLSNDLQSSGERVVFISADDRLIQAARSEGFLADNPNHH
jgi:hypothetical protein